MIILRGFHREVKKFLLLNLKELTPRLALSFGVLPTKLLAMTDSGKRDFWTGWGRTVVFLLAATSIACLLFDFYGLCPMRTFTIFIFFPSVVALFAFAIFDRLRGNGRLWRAVMLGLLAGFIAAISYDIFRLPFVFAKELGIASVIPTMGLFKVFPRFGAMILDQPIEQDHYSLATQILGWIYHFSNGMTFGVMYMALIGDGSKRQWWWAVVMAVGIELGMLFTPYSGFFKIPLTAAFVYVTLAAHMIFGVTMGRWIRHNDRRYAVA